MSDGSDITVVDGDKVLVFPPLLGNSLSLTRAMEESPGSVRLSIYWQIYAGVAQKHIDLTEGVADISWVDENETRTGIEQTWNEREIWVTGNTGNGYSYGHADERIELTITPSEVVDTGTIYPPGSEHISDRWPDVAETSDGSRAKNTLGKYAPIPIAPADTESQIATPLLCVQDVMDAVLGVSDLGFAQLVITYEQMWSTTSRDIWFVNPLRTGSIIADSAYTGTGDITATTDSAATNCYTTTHDWYEAVSGTASNPITFTAGSPDVTGSRWSKYLPGDHVKKLGDGDDDYLEADSIDGTTLTLVANYATSSPSFNARIIRRLADQAYSAYMLTGAHGGITSLCGDGALSNPMDVCEWALDRSSMSTPVAVGDLRGYRTRFSGWQIATVINDDVVSATPDSWSWLEGHIFPLLPLRWYSDGNAIRWIDWSQTDQDEVVCTIDLDDETCGVVRADLVSMPDDSSVVNEIQLSYNWRIFYGSHQARLTVTGDSGSLGGPGGTTKPGILGNGYARASQLGNGAVGQTLPLKRATTAETDCVVAEATSAHVANHRVYRGCIRRPGLILRCLPEYRWVTLGDLIRVKQETLLGRKQLWRVESIQRESGGETTLTCEYEGPWAGYVSRVYDGEDALYDGFDLTFE